jgi:hypothetical protein
MKNKKNKNFTFSHNSANPVKFFIISCTSGLNVLIAELRDKTTKNKKNNYSNILINIFYLPFLTSLFSAMS